MKTVEELCKEIDASAELQNELKAASDETKLGEFLKNHGCDADVKEFIAYVNSKNEGELKDDDADASAGVYPTRPEIRLVLHI